MKPQVLSGKRCRTTPDRPTSYRPAREIFSKLGVAQTDLNQADDIFPARFSVSSGPVIKEPTKRGKRKGERNDRIDSIKTIYFSVSHRLWACLLWAFTCSASCQSS